MKKIIFILLILIACNKKSSAPVKYYLFQVMNDKTRPNGEIYKLKNTPAQAYISNDSFFTNGIQFDNAKRNPLTKYQNTFWIKLPDQKLNSVSVNIKEPNLFVGVNSDTSHKVYWFVTKKEFEKIETSK